MNIHETINYLEIPTTDIKKSEEFFSKIFSWKFEKFGEDYISFSDKYINGAFFTSNQVSQSRTGSVLIVFYSDNLEDTYNKIIEAKGTIVQETFNFPGGRRFHFEDLTANEFAVWSK